MLRSIRWKLSLTYVLLVLASMLVLGVCLMQSLENYFVANLRAQLLIEARLIGMMVEKELFPASPGGEPSVLENFSQTLAERTRASTQSRVTIIDRNGVVQGDSAEKPGEMENHLDRPEVLDAVNQGEGWAIRKSHTLGHNMLYVAVPVETNGDVRGFIRLAIPLTEVEQTVHRLWQMIFLAALLGLLVAGLLGMILARRATLPLEEMTRAAQEIARGNFKQRRYSTSQDELGILAESLNHMAATLKQMLAEVAAGKTRLESVLENMVSGVVFVGPAGKVDLINPAAISILSLEKLSDKLNHLFQKEQRLSKAKMFIGKPHSIVIRHFHLSTLIDEVIASHQSRREEIQILTPAEKIIEVNLSPIIGPEGQNLGLVVVLHDITELRRLERVRTDFVANVSHELKTPITSVRGFAETLLEGALDDRSVAEEFIRIIYQEAERLTAIINDLLQLSRFELQPESIRPEPFEIISFIRRIGNKFSPVLQDHAHRLDLTLPAQEVWALGDSDRLEQVMDNLLDNAIKYTPSGGVITIKVEEVGPGVKVEICDTGIGISSEERKRIFERFYRVDKARSRKVGGTGLGLSIVKHILEAHGTEITVADGKQRGLNKGTCFGFILEKAKRV